MKYRIFIILLLGVILRISYWLYTTPPVTTDIAYWGLMSKGFQPHVWRYGTVSVGAVYSYLIAVLTPILGTFSMPLVELVFSGLFILTAYYIGNRLFGGRIGFVSALLISLAPHYLIKAAMFPTGVYNIIIFLGSLLLLLSIKEKVNYILLGLIGGISFWIHIYAVFFLFPCIVFALVNKSLKIRSAVILIISFFIGSFPFWLYNFSNNFHTFNNITLRPIEDILVYNARDIMSLQLNNMLNIRSPLSISSLLLIVYFISIIYSCYRLKERLFTSKEGLVVIFVFFSAVLISRINMGPDLDLHPAIILYAGLPYMAVYLLRDISKRFRFIIPLFIILQLIDTGLNAITDNSEKQGLDRLMTHLKENNINHVYTSSKLAPIVNFLTDERIRAGFYENYMDLPYTVSADAAIDSSILVPLEKSKGLIENLRYVCADYKRIDMGQYVLFHSFVRPSTGQKEVSPSGWDAEANYNNEDVGLAFDRDVATCWTTHVRKTPNMYFKLDLGAETPINKIVVFLGPYLDDKAIGLKIEVSGNDVDWKEVVLLEDNSNVLFWSGPHLFLKNYADRQEYYFKPIIARYIRLTQLGYLEEDFNYWTITELFVYTPADNGVRQGYNIDNIRAKGLDNVYADYWLTVNLNGDEKISKDIDLSKNPVIVTEVDIDNEFKKYNIIYKKDIEGDFLIYHSFEGRATGLISIDKDDWSATSNIQPYVLGNAFDNNLETRWSTDRFQAPGYYYQIDLKDDRYISGIRLWHKGSPNDWPRDIRIEVLDNNSQWQALDYEKDFSDSLFWNGFSITANTAKYYTYIFKPVKTRAIRCTLEEGSDKYYWSIHEADLLTTIKQ